MARVLVYCWVLYSWVAIAGLALAASAAPAQVPRYRLEVVASYPHDPGAFTQGLVWAGDGEFYESVGRYGHSALRRVALRGGAVLDAYRLGDDYFAEGLAQVGERLFQLTWKAGRGFVYTAGDLSPAGSFAYPGQGWGLAYDGERLILSDGSASLRFLDPATLEKTGELTVRVQGRPVPRLNELEVIRGQLWANVWPSNLIVRIDLATGAVTGIIDGSGLRRQLPAGYKVDALNGIAYDAKNQRIFVTGKLWPRLFEVRLAPWQP